jgi:UDP-N-acetylmuramoylalanine--D-glutamate ligase
VRLADLKGRSVAVWGTDEAARAALRAVASAGASRLLAVSDRADYAELAWDPSVAPLAGGDHAFPALVTADVVVGCVPGHPWLADLESRGIPVTSGTALWLVDHAANTITVTGSDTAAALIAHLLTAFDRPVLTGGPPVSLPPGKEYVVSLSATECASVTSSPRVAVLCTSIDHQLNLLQHGPEMIVVNGTDLPLRDALRGLTDINRFPPIPAGAPDSRFRTETDTVFCSDDPLFPRATLTTPGEAATLELCVALAVLDGLGIDVVTAKADLATAVAAFTPPPPSDS